MIKSLFLSLGIATIGASSPAQLAAVQNQDDVFKTSSFVYKAATSISGFTPINPNDTIDSAPIDENGFQKIDGIFKKNGGRERAAYKIRDTKTNFIWLFVEGDDSNTIKWLNDKYNAAKLILNSRIITKKTDTIVSRIGEAFKNGEDSGMKRTPGYKFKQVDDIRFTSSLWKEDGDDGSTNTKFEINNRGIIMTYLNLLKDQSKIVHYNIENSKLQGLLFSPGYTINNPPVKTLSFYPRIYINEVQMWKSEKLIELDLPQGAQDGLEWWRPFVQLSTLGLSELAKIIGIGLVNLISIITNGAINKYSEAIDYLVRNKYIRNKVFDTGNGFTFYKGMHSTVIKNIMNSKYYYQLNEKLKKDNNIEIDAKTYGEAHATTLFWDNTEINFTSQTTIALIDIAYEEISYDKF